MINIEIIKISIENWITLPLQASHELKHTIHARTLRR
jgi:hypothetical protein